MIFFDKFVWLYKSTPLSSLQHLLLWVSLLPCFHPINTARENSKGVAEQFCNAFVFCSNEKQNKEEEGKCLFDRKCVDKINWFLQDVESIGGIHHATLIHVSR